MSEQRYHLGVDVLSAVVTLFLVMDPLGNVPLFLSILKTVAPERRRRILLRELAIAYVVLVGFLLLGKTGATSGKRGETRSGTRGLEPRQAVQYRCAFPRGNSHVQSGR